MAFSNKLHNPTPFDVRFNYHKGVDIKIPAFAHVDLPMEYVEDFVKGRPGSEAVYSEIDFYGIFLEDPNRSYEDQAVEAIGNAIRMRETTVKEVTDNIRNSVSARGGQVSAEVIEEQLELSKVLNLREQVKEMKKLVGLYSKTLATQKPKSAIRSYDLSRTILVLDPPKEFPTKEAMQFYLETHPDVRAAHEATQTRTTQAPEYSSEELVERRGPGRPRKVEVANE